MEERERDREREEVWRCYSNRPLVYGIVSVHCPLLLHSLFEDPLIVTIMCVSECVSVCGFMWVCNPQSCSAVMQRFATPACACVGCARFYAQHMSDWSMHALSLSTVWLTTRFRGEMKRCIIRPTKKDKKWQSVIDVIDEYCYKLYAFNIHDRFHKSVHVEDPVISIYS